MFSLGQGKNSWELPFREKIALLNVLVDLVLDCESMAETLDKVNKAYLEEKAEHFAEIREEKAAKQKKLKQAEARKKKQERRANGEEASSSEEETDDEESSSDDDDDDDDDDW